MTGPTSLSDLEAFAREQIAAHRYPSDHHPFRPFSCDACGLVAFELTVEHHSGSKEGDFKGMIWGKCTKCGTCFEVCPPRFGAVKKISGEPVPTPIPEEARITVRKSKGK